MDDLEHPPRSIGLPGDADSTPPFLLQPLPAGDGPTAPQSRLLRLRRRVGDKPIQIGVVLLALALLALGVLIWPRGGTVSDNRPDEARAPVTTAVTVDPTKDAVEEAVAGAEVTPPATVPPPPGSVPDESPVPTATPGTASATSPSITTGSQTSQGSSTPTANGSAGQPDGSGSVVNTEGPRPVTDPRPKNIRCDYGEIVTNFGYPGTLWEVFITWDDPGPAAVGFEINTTFFGPGGIIPSAYQAEERNYFRLVRSNRYGFEEVDSVSSIDATGQRLAELPPTGCGDTPPTRQPQLSVAVTPTVGRTVVYSVLPLSTTEQTKWEWDFGDGTTSTERSPSHAFTRAGTFKVSVKVSTKPLPEGTGHVLTKPQNGIEGFEIISRDIVVS